MDRETLLRKKAKFEGMRSTGFVMGGLGVAMLPGGIILASKGEYETKRNYDGSTTQEAQDGIGNKKVHQYQTLLAETSVGFEYGKNRQGLRLSYTF